MQKYVLGFIFNTSMDLVALMEKQRPDWQKGKFNGIGGKVEEGETYREAIAREGMKEAGLPEETQWEHFAMLGDDKKQIFEVAVFLTKLWRPQDVKLNLTDERIRWFSTSFLPPDAIPNVEMLIAAARSIQKEKVLYYDIREKN